jgi:hypothetical protein
MEKQKTKESARAKSKRLALHYMETLTEVARESFLILNADLKVLSANPIFYDTFKVTRAQTEGKFIYDLGNGQWDIPSLKDLLEKILPEKKIVENYEVKHVFPNIGEKTIQLNAQQVDSVQLIILALEDITNRKDLEEKTAERARELEAKVLDRTKELSARLKELESLNKTMIGRELKMVELKKEIVALKKLIPSNRNNG